MAAQMFEKEGQKEESDAARPRSKVGNLYFSAVIERRCRKRARAASRGRLHGATFAAFSTSLFACQLLAKA